MTFVQFEIFSAVIELQSFKKAAKHLNIPQSAIRYAITSLENKFETQLLKRKSDQIVLTAMGQKVWEHLQNASHQISSITKNLETTILEQISREMSQGVGLIKVGGSQETLHYIQEEIILDFRKKHPNIKVDVFIGHGNQIEQWVHSSIIDIGMVTLEEENRSMVNLMRKHFKVMNVPALSFFYFPL